MEFYAIPDQVPDLLQWHGWVTYLASNSHAAWMIRSWKA
jgi:hypothetical protein